MITHFEYQVLLLFGVYSYMNMFILFCMFGFVLAYIYSTNIYTSIFVFYFAVNLKIKLVYSYLVIRVILYISGIYYLKVKTNKY